MAKLEVDTNSIQAVSQFPSPFPKNATIRIGVHTNGKFEIVVDILGF